MMSTSFDLIVLADELLVLEPLQSSHFEVLFQAASDPLIWEQHPMKLRYQEPVFREYFDSAILSKGALLVRDSQTDEVAGCSRYYDFDSENSTVKIGYTFLTRKYWGGKYNGALKSVMLTYAFQFVDRVLFEVGSNNMRSQKAMEKIGGLKIGETMLTFSGAPTSLNFIYAIDKSNWKV
jgi:RimJ/RimL family protein N-acetyltransferase